MRRHPYLLLAGAALLWAGNFVIGRAVHGRIPPVGLAFWRWTLAAAMLLALHGRGLVAQRRPLLEGWRVVVALGILGAGCFNLFLYVGLQHTTAANALLLNAAAPAFILLLSALAGLGRPTPRMAAGVLLSLAGVAVIVSRGDPAALVSLQVNRGDLWVLAAVVSWSIYTVVLPRRPAGVEPMVLITATTVVGAAWIAPFYALEVARGLRMPIDPSTVATLAYVSIFASIVAYALWNAGVAAAGPGPAGVSLNLMPAFGTVLAVALLGEPFHAFQAAGIALIGAGVALVQLRRTG